MLSSPWEEYIGLQYIAIILAQYLIAVYWSIAISIGQLKNIAISISLAKNIAINIGLVKDIAINIGPLKNIAINIDLLENIAINIDLLRNNSAISIDFSLSATNSVVFGLFWVDSRQLEENRGSRKSSRKTSSHLPH